MRIMTQESTTADVVDTLTLLRPVAVGPQMREISLVAAYG